MVFRRVILPNKFFCDIGAFNFYFNYFIFNLLDFTLFLHVHDTYLFLFILVVGVVCGFQVCFFALLRSTGAV